MLKNQNELILFLNSYFSENSGILEIICFEKISGNEKTKKKSTKDI